MARGVKYFQGHPLSFPNIPLHTQQREKNAISTPLAEKKIKLSQANENLSISLSHCTIVL
jgi:hypothetical protein